MQKVYLSFFSFQLDGKDNSKFMIDNSSNIYEIIYLKVSEI